MGPKKKAKKGGGKGKKGLIDEDDLKSFNFNEREVLQKMMKRHKALLQQNHELKAAHIDYLESNQH